MILVIRKKHKIVFFTAILMAVLIIAYNFIPKLIYPLKHEEYIHKYADLYDLDPYLIMGVISAESRFDESATSHKGAIGLMQLKEDTAKWCIEKLDISLLSDDLYNPETNINIGCAYLKYLKDMFEEDKSAIAAYNAGLGNVKKWLSDENYSSDGKTLKKVPFAETEKYVKVVFKRSEIYEKLYKKTVSFN